MAGVGGGLGEEEVVKWASAASAGAVCEWPG